MKKLVKPSVPVWAANQLARREPGEVSALLRSADGLRKAQEQALAGKGGDDLGERLAEQRKAVRALARLGRHILTDEGRSASDAMVERIGKTLEAAALDERSRSLLRAGRLTAELEPPGFEALAQMAATGVRRKQSRAAAPKRKRDRVAAARRQVQEARQEARTRAHEAAAAERDADRAEAAANEARRAADEARESAEAAERTLAEAEAALRDAQRGA